MNRHAFIAAALAVTSCAAAQSLAPEFEPFYELVDLGPIASIPSPYGGITFKKGDPQTILLGGDANEFIAKIYEIAVTRDANNSIIGFGCAEPVFVANAPGLTGGLDGGLDYGPGDVLFYTTWSDNTIGQIRPGESNPARITELTPLGVTGTTGTLRFVPPGFAGAGRLKIASYSTSVWYDATVASLGDGTYDIDVTPAGVQLSGGPEGIVYIAAGSPGFEKDSVLLSRYGASGGAQGNVGTYEIDENGDPIPESFRLFIDGLVGAEGAVIDPLTGDFLFSTFGTFDRIIRVSGFMGVGCLGDLNLDGVVNGADITVILGNWGATTGGTGDANGNCVVDGADIAVVLGNWGPCSP